MVDADEIAISGGGSGPDAPDRASGRARSWHRPSSLAQIRTYVLPSTDARRVPDRAVQIGADAGARDAVPLVDQSVHGLRAPLHVLLRPPLRAACRSSVRRSL